jgi:hypothetical protein
VTSPKKRKEKVITQTWISISRCKAILTEIESPPMVIGTITTIEIIETINTIVFMTQKEDNTIQITNGIDITDGDSKSNQVKLLHHMIQILTFKDHIMITMTHVIMLDIGLE